MLLEEKELRKRDRRPTFIPLKDELVIENRDTLVTRRAAEPHAGS
jgi:hypothetical protein